MSITLSPLFSDGMVLQRGNATRLWGTSDTAVTVSFLDRQYTALPSKTGQWSVLLENLSAGGPYSLTINEITLRDVYVGDVWILAGQSNMQLTLERARYRYPEMMTEENPRIRLFGVSQRTDFHGPRSSLSGGSWSGATPESLPDFSAVGYFFARRLHARYNVPIGLIATAIGGTPIHAWMSREMLQGFPHALEEADTCADDTHVARIQAKDAQEAQRFFQAVDDADPGLTDRWSDPGLDDSDWVEQSMLTPWEGAGSVWLRKTVDIPASWAEKPAMLFLGTLKDWDTVYVNGQPVGTTTYRYPPRAYAVPPLPAGRCVIAVRAICKNGGGFAPGKPYVLSSQEGAIDLRGAWRFRLGGQVTPPTPETAFHYKPTGLYNGMIAPLMPYTAKGVCWYQGESDSEKPEGYADKFEALVAGWREGFGQALPFLFVELPHWAEGVNWDSFRAQQWAALRIPGTAMAAAFDLGEHNDLHPQGKQAVGDRLARCAMRLCYGEALPPSPFEILGTKLPEI